MKRFLLLLLTAALVLSSVSALAVTIDPNENRHIKLTKVGDNDYEEGYSPTTGLLLADYDLPVGYTGLAVTGEYTPMMVQIDNTNGGVNLTTTSDSGAELTILTAPWGLSFADIIYETPLYSWGATRISAIFSDLLPTAVGPVRSARVGHAWLREEWGAGLVFWGGQKYAKTKVSQIFSSTGVSKQKYFIFDGTNGGNKPWLEFMERRKGAGYKSPSNCNANVSALATLLPEGYNFPNHTFKFTDDIPEGDDATSIRVSWEVRYSSQLEYDFDSNTYFRYMVYPKGQLVPYEDRETGSQLNFSNVIIQWTDTEWSRTDAPVTKYLPYELVKDGLPKFKYKGGGEGNADYFMCGVHMKGYWKHDAMNTRTVFYDENGEELALQRGKTMIISLPLENSCTYE